MQCAHTFYSSSFLLHFLLFLLPCVLRPPLPLLFAARDQSSARGNATEVWTRVTPGVEYVKVTVHKGRVVGAMLIGDTDLEETMENLIHNRLDVSRLGIELLDPDIDIEDYFD